MNFVPKLAQAKQGHFVTIQPNSHAAKPFLNSKSEIRELIKHLSNSNSMHDTLYNFNELPLELRMVNNHKQQLQLSTVIYKTKNSDSNCKLINILDLNVCEIAERIIDGIQSEKKCIEITERRSLIEYILNVIKFKFA